MTRTRLVLFAHGSPDPRWMRPIEQLARDVAAVAGADSVRTAYLQFIGPSLRDIAAEAAGDGFQALRILPLFLSTGAHVERDIPAEVRAIRRVHPDLQVNLLPSVGPDPRLRALLRTLILEAALAPSNTTPVASGRDSRRARPRS